MRFDGDGRVGGLEGCEAELVVRGWCGLSMEIAAVGGLTKREDQYDF